MSILRGHRCDICEKETFEYKPKGWRRVEFERRGLDGIVQQSLGAHCCGDACEQQWDEKRRVAWEALNE